MDDALLLIPILGKLRRERVEKTNWAELKSWESALEVKIISLTSTRIELRNQGSGNYINLLKEENRVETTESRGNKSHWTLLYSLSFTTLVCWISSLLCGKKLSARPWQNVVSHVLDTWRFITYYLCHLLCSLKGRVLCSGYTRSSCCIMLGHNGCACYRTSVHNLLFSSLNNHL